MKVRQRPLWTYEEIDTLERLASEGATLPDLMEAFPRRTRMGIKAKANRLCLIITRQRRVGKPSKVSRKERFQPTDEEWHRIASEEAAKANIRIAHVVGPSNVRAHAQARWRAWRRILDENPHCSIAGVARVSGWDHTSLLSGLKRLDAMSNSR